MIRMTRNKRSISSSEAEDRGRGLRKKTRKDDDIEMFSDEENNHVSDYSRPSTPKDRVYTVPQFPTLSYHSEPDSELTRILPTKNLSVPVSSPQNSSPLETSQDPPLANCSTPITIPHSKKPNAKRNVCKLDKKRHHCVFSEKTGTEPSLSELGHVLCNLSSK